LTSADKQRRKKDCGNGQPFIIADSAPFLPSPLKRILAQVTMAQQRSFRIIPSDRNASKRSRPAFPQRNASSFRHSLPRCRNSCLHAVFSALPAESHAAHGG